MRKVGYKNVGNNSVVKKRIKKLGLDVSHFKKGNHVTNNSFKKIPLKDICIENGTYSTNCLKKRLFKELNWEHKCSF